MHLAYQSLDLAVLAFEVLNLDIFESDDLFQLLDLVRLITMVVFVDLATCITYEHLGLLALIRSKDVERSHSRVAWDIRKVSLRVGLALDLYILNGELFDDFQAFLGVISVVNLLDD